MRLVLFIIFLCSTAISYGQELISERAIKDARAISTDEIGNVYIVYADNSLVQYNEKGDSISNFRSIQYGDLAYIDTRNPLKILLFYPDFSRIIILDRMLSLKNEIDLRQLGIFQGAAVGMAMDGNIWVFDANNVQLIKMDENSNIINKSDDLRSSIQSIPEPITLEENERKVYLLDTLNGIFVFDQFANFLNNIKLEQVSQLQVYNSLLIYRSGHQLINYNPLTGAKNTLALPQDADFLSARIERGKLFFLFKNKLSVYKLAP